MVRYRMKEWLTRCGMTMQELSEKSGVGLRVICRMCNEEMKRGCGTETMDRLCEALNASEDELTIGEVGRPPQRDDTWHRYHLHLRKLLRERGLNQATFAQMTGLNKATVMRWCRPSTYVVQKATLKKMQDALGVTADELVTPIRRPGWMTEK